MQSILAVALIPVLVLGFFIYRKDSAHPEPISMLLKGLAYGAISAVLTLVVLYPFDSLLSAHSNLYTLGGAAVAAFGGAAIPEELCKLFMLWLLVRKSRHYDEPLDGIVYAACVGLGFAGFENVLYLVEANEYGELLSVGISRGIFSVPGHFCFAVFMGYYYALATFGYPSSKSSHMIKAALIPIAIHGIYDMLLMFQNEQWFILAICVWFVFVIVMFVKAYKRINRLKKMQNQLYSVYQGSEADNN